MSIDTFKSRLKYYIVGVGIGTACAFLFFGNRGCSWLPGNRVRNMIAEQDILVGDSMASVMSCRGITNKEVYDLLDDGGDVDFTLSETHVYPKEYHINGAKGDQEIWIRYALFDTVSEVIGCSGAASCTGTSSNEVKKIISLPLEEVLLIIQSHRFRIMDPVRCQMKYYNLSENEVLHFHESIKLYVLESRPHLDTDPYHILRGFIGSEEFDVKYVIGENRTRISNISSRYRPCNCP